MIKFSTCIKDFEFDVKFRNWNFKQILSKFFVSNFEIHVCVNIDCENILNGKKLVQNKCLKIEIHSMTTLLRIRNIETTTHEINEYIKIFIYMFNVKENKQVLTCIDREISFENDLKTNLLIENDFLRFEEFIIDVSDKKITIVNFDVTIDLFIDNAIYTLNEIFMLIRS